MIKDTCSSALIKTFPTVYPHYSAMCKRMEIFMKLLGTFIMKLISLLRQHRGTEVVFVLKSIPDEEGGIKIEGKQ